MQALEPALKKFKMSEDSVHSLDSKTLNKFSRQNAALGEQNFILNDRIMISFRQELTLPRSLSR